MSSRWTAAVSLLVCLPLALSAEDAGWTLESRDAAGGGEAGAVLVQVSSDAIADEYGSKQVNPEMQFRCGNGGIVAQIDWRRFISSFNTELGFKADDGRNRWHKWKVDRSNQITISPSADDTSAIIEKMLTGNMLTVDVTPYSEAPVQVRFDLAGFADAIETLRAGCD